MDQQAKDEKNDRFDCTMRTVRIRQAEPTAFDPDSIVVAAMTHTTWTFSVHAKIHFPRISRRNWRQVIETNQSDTSG